MAGANPTIRRRELGSRLRALRTERGLTVENVAESMAVSAAKISRIETAARGASVADVQFLAQLYGVSAEELDHLLTLTKEGRRSSWWEEYKLPYSTYVGLEVSARVLYDYGTSYIPGLLQTRDYAQAVVSAFLPDEEISRATELTDARMRRQQVLQGDPPLQLNAVFDEAALHREVGGRRVLVEQLTELARRAEAPNIAVRMIPYEAGAHPGMDSNFTILQIEEPGVADVVYVEGLLGHHYLAAPQDLDRYHRVFRRLSSLSIDHDATVARVLAIRDTLSEEGS